MRSATRRRIACITSLLLFIGILILVTALWGNELIALVEDPDAFRQRTDAMGWTGRLLFVGLIALQVILAVLPGQIFALAGGYCFGSFQGLLLTVVGTALGSAVAFLLSRALGLRAVTSFYPEEKLQKPSFLKESKRQIFITFLIFLIPGIPKDMVSYFMGLTQMRFPVFMLISTLGRLPAMALTVLGGAAIQSNNLTLIIVIAAATLVLLFLGALLYRHRKAVKKENSSTDL